MLWILYMGKEGRRCEHIETDVIVNIKSYMDLEDTVYVNIWKLMMKKTNK